MGGVSLAAFCSYLALRAGHGQPEATGSRATPPPPGVGAPIASGAQAVEVRGVPVPRGRPRLDSGSASQGCKPQEAHETNTQGPSKGPQTAGPLGPTAHTCSHPGVSLRGLGR